MPQPGDQLSIQTWFDVKRASGLEHPLEPLKKYTGCRQGYTVAWNDKPGIAIGASGADIIFIHHQDIFAQLVELMGAANSDSAAADYQRVRLPDHISNLLAEFDTDFRLHCPSRRSGL